MSVESRITSRESRVVGKPAKRIEGLEKVTGSARYTEDLYLPGMLHARLVLSPHPHARVVAVPREIARAGPGVAAVVTEADLPEGVSSQLLADDETRYTGQPVAAVLAETEAAAVDGADRLAAAVEYEVLPAVLTPAEAMRDGAPLVVEHVEEDNEAAAHATVSAGTVKETLPRNVASRYHFTRGDIAQGVREADVLIERTYTTGRLHQAYMEPHATIAAPDPGTETGTVYTSTQGQFYVRSETADALGIPQHQVRVVPMTVGGGFGGEIVPFGTPAAAKAGGAWAGPAAPRPPPGGLH